MQEYPGKFIVLEGSDGSGKTTQFRLLGERLQAVGYEVAVFDFPRYDQPSSHFVKRYLNGDYGPASQVNPYTASMFYALDRYEAAADIREALEAGKIVLSNRYAGSNMAHQGSKFTDEAEQRGFFVWADSLEFSLLGIPRPDLNLFLRVPAEISFKLIGEKHKRSYTDKSHDQHEADINHLRKSVATYDLLCQLFPKDFIAVECSENGQILSIPSINNKIWENLRPLLPPTPPNKGHKVVVQLGRPSPAPAASEPAAAPLQVDQVTVKLNATSLLAVGALEAAAGISVEFTKPWQSDNKQKPYYLPSGLSDKLAHDYNAGMKSLAKLQQQLQKSMAVYLRQQKMPEPEVLAYRTISPVIPLAALVPVTISGSTLAVSRLASQLQTSPNSELKSIACRLKQSLKNQGAVQKNAPIKTISSLLEQDDLPGNISAAVEPLELLDYWPRSEFSLLADGIYPYTDLGRDEIAMGVERWTYERKQSALRTMAMDPGNQVLNKAQYRWDVISNRLALSDAVGRGLVNELQAQAPTVRYGYEVPELVERAGLENEFMECFDTSLQLYSHLQAASKDVEMSYAVLLGHKLRWQFSVNAKELANESAGTKAKSTYAELLNSIMEKVAEVHPILGTALGQLAESQPSKSDSDVPIKKKRSHRRSRKTRR